MTVPIAVATPAPVRVSKAERLLGEARAYVSASVAPSELSYRVVVTFLADGGGSSVRTYDSAFDAATNAVFTHTMSEEEYGHAYVPKGINFVVGATASTATGSTGASYQLNKPDELPDVIGVPMLSPTYAFQLGHEHATVTVDEPGGLPVIGEVRAVTRDYRATYLGDEEIAGEICAHLQLEPTAHPEELRLRELWVAADGAPLQAVAHGNFTTRPWNGLDWTITFRRDRSALYLDSEKTIQSIRVDRYRRGRVVVAFRDVKADDIRRSFLTVLEPNDPIREP